MVALLNMPRAAWKRQPNRPLQVNWNNPLTNQLILLTDLLQGREVVSQTSMTKVGTKNVVRSDGRSLGFLSPYGVGATDRVVTSLNAPLNQFSTFNLFLRNGAGGNNLGRIFSSSFTQIYNVGTEYHYLVVFSTTTGVWIMPRLFDGQFLNILTTHDASATANDPKIYINGQSVSLMRYASPGGTAIGFTGVFCVGNIDAGTRGWDGLIKLNVVWGRVLSPFEVKELSTNPWQLFAPAPSRFILIPSIGGATTYTDTLSIDALIQRAGLTQSTTIDALLQSAFSTSLSLDSLIAAVQSETLSLDALLQIVGTRTVSVDALLQAAKSGTVSIDSLVQMTLAQSLSLDALIMAASTSSAAVSLDALIQAFQTAGVSLDALLSTARMQSVVLDALLQSGKTGSISLDGLIQAIQTKTLSLDALLSQSMNTAAVMDALIQSSKTGAVSLDALITGSSATTIFTGLDALIQAIQSKTLSVDALLQKAYTSPLALDAYVALTQVKTISLDALLQSTKTGALSLDAIIQMTKTTMLSFDALIQAAKTGILSLDAILVFATQASVLLDAYVQKAVLRGVGLDAIIGAIADMVMPTGRVVAVPASDRWVFVTPSDRFIQV